MKQLSIILSLLLFLALIGCDLTDSKTSAEAQDESAVVQLLNESDYIYTEVDDGDESTYDVDDPNWDNSMEKATADSTWKRAIFGRKITHRERNIEVVLTSDSTATAYVHWRFEGEFISLTGELAGDSVSRNRFTKRLLHNENRIVNLVKINRRFMADSAVYRHRGWKIESISLGDGLSEPNSINIVELAYQVEGEDRVVITDPLQFFFDRDNFFILPRNTMVRVQVKVDNQSPNKLEYPMGSGSYENVRLHYGRNRMGHHGKSGFSYDGQDENGYQVYSGAWRVAQFIGKHHAIVDVIDNGTIFNPDSSAYYNSATWGTPYVVGIPRGNLGFAERRAQGR
jgi:hypothetical protein